MCLNQVELAVFTWYISTIKLFVQPIVYTYQKLFHKLKLTFLFSPLCSDIENIESKMYLHGF